MNDYDKSRVCAMVLGIAFVILGSVFTLGSAILEHSPVGFEKRGGLHYGWHFAILIGGLTLMIGLTLRDRAFEVAGLLLCGGVVLWNLAAVITAGDAASTGFEMTLRIVVFAWIVLRLIDIDALGIRRRRGPHYIPLMRDNPDGTTTEWLPPEEDR